MAKPIFGEWHRTAKGNESLIVSGDFTDVKQFLIWGVGMGDPMQCLIPTDAHGNQALTDQQAAILLPPGLGFDVYSVWAVNNANESSDPILINKAEITWLQQEIRPGERAQILGFNLSQNQSEESNDAYVFFHPVGGGMAVEAVVNEANPWRIEYTVPNLTAGAQYDVYVHNGHGGAYGLSEPVRITASAAIVWGPTMALQAKVGTDVSDVERFERTWNAARTANNRTQISFNQTLYFHRPATLFAGVGIRVIGGSKATARILAGTSATDGTYAAGGGGGVSGLIEFTGSPNTVYFENVTFDMLGKVINQFVNCLNMKFSNYLRFYNCDINAYGVQPINIENSNNCQFHNVTTTGRIFYVGNANQTFLYNCLGIQSNDATSYIQIWGGDGFFAYNCTTRDLDANGDQTSENTFGMGRMFSGNASFGGQINWHIEKCSGLGLTPRSGGADQNSGEIFMWEGNLCRASGFAMNISADGKTFTLANVKDLGSLGRGWAKIIGGKGIGQYNRIASRTTNTVTVQKEWRVKPDSTSVIVVGHFSYNMVVYNTPLATGKPNATDPDYVNASSMVKPFGGSIRNVCDKCTSDGTRTGIETFVTVHNASYAGSWPGYEPVYWNTYTRNTLKNNLIGFKNQMEFNHTGEKAGTTCIFGTVFRYNSIQNPIQADITFDSAADLPNGNRMMVIEHNQFTGEVDLMEPRGSANGLVFRNNTKYVGV